jgi:DNA-binding response OmpR family regulator
MLKILVIEDDPSILRLYGIILRKAGYETLEAQNGLDAWDIMEKEYVDLIITDVMMPEMDGYEFVRLLRETNPVMPVLMITAKEDFISKNIGFSLGADDYMVKPVDSDEMLLRVKALLRRSNIMSPRKIEVYDTVLDYDALTVTSNQQTSMLPQKEFYLLYKLMSYPNKIFTRIQLMDEIWGRNSSSEAQTIDVHINRLRRRFQDNQDFEIVTIRGLGYKVVINNA